MSDLPDDQMDQHIGPLITSINSLLGGDGRYYHTLSSIADWLRRPPEFVRGLLHTMLLSRLAKAVVRGRAVVYERQEDTELLVYLDQEGPATLRELEKEVGPELSDCSLSMAEMVADLVKDGTVRRVEREGVELFLSVPVELPE